MHGYVYVEPFELRKEFAIRLRAFPDWTAGVPLDGVLDKSHQARIQFEVAKILSESCPLEIDGAPLKLQLDSIRFVQVEPIAGVIPDERAAIPVREAQIAAGFGAPLRGYPNEVSVHWNLFPSDPATKVLLSFVARGGKSSVYPTKASPLLKWAVPKKKEVGELIPIPKVSLVQPSTAVHLPFFTMLFAVLAVLCGLAGRLLRGTPKLFAGSAAALFLVGAVAFWAVSGLSLRASDSRSQPLSTKDADALVHALLKNIYASFDYREESEIYDVLARSVSGNLLEKIYLDVRRGLELEQKGGPRVKINHVDLRSCQVERVKNGDGLRADAEWVAVGDITHWGHIHTRLNKYRAWLTIQPIDSTWKVIDIEIVEESRI